MYFDTYFCIEMQLMEQLKEVFLSLLVVPYILLFPVQHPSLFLPIQRAIACGNHSKVDLNPVLCNKNWIYIVEFSDHSDVLMGFNTYKCVIDSKSSNAPSGIVEMSLPWRELLRKKIKIKINTQVSWIWN